MDEILNLIESVSEGWVLLPTSAVSKHHIVQNVTSFGVNVDEDQDRLLTFHWLPKMHKQPYKARFIANSSSS